MEDPSADSTVNGWLLTPATNLVEFVANETLICALTQNVMVTAPVLPTVLVAAAPYLAAANPEALAVLASAVKSSDAVAEFAKAEIDAGFATILSHHAVAMWAAVETASEQTLVNLIRKVPTAHEVIVEASPSLNAEKVRTKTSNEADKALNLWRGALKMHSFDKDIFMLDAFGLKLNLSPPHRQALVEMSEVRNVLLHQGGFVDAKFLTKAPWVPLKVGQKLAISRTRMTAYVDAAHAFASALIGAAVRSPYIVRRAAQP